MHTALAWLGLLRLALTWVLSWKLLYESMITPQEGFTVSKWFFSFLGASPDALIQCMCCGQGVVEIKCPLCASKTSFREVTHGFCLDELPGDKFELLHDHVTTISANFKCL